LPSGSLAGRQYGCTPGSRFAQQTRDRGHVQKVDLDRDRRRQLRSHGSGQFLDQNVQKWKILDNQENTCNNLLLGLMFMQINHCMQCM